MKRRLGSKVWTIAGFIIILMILVAMYVLCRKYYKDNSAWATQEAMLDGEYSVDGGEWKPFIGEKYLTEHFQRIVIRWEVKDIDMTLYDNLNISAKNVWFRLSNEEGKTLLERTYKSYETFMDEAYKLNSETLPPDNPMQDREYFEAHINIDKTMEMYMPDTPGYTARVLNMAEIRPADWSYYATGKGPVLTLEVENSYDDGVRFSDCFSVIYSGDNGVYLLFFRNAMPAILIFTLVCFFGLFLFPIAGFILGKADYRYLTFGGLCFLWGLFMIFQRISDYLNLWIRDATLCMAVVTLMKYILILSIMFYMKANLKRETGRMIANLTSMLFLLAMTAAAVCHFTLVWDLYASSDVMNAVTALCMVILAVLLFQEAKSSPGVVHVLIALAPLTLSILLDALNDYFDFTYLHFYYFGLTITMLYQIFRIIMDLRTQHKEAIRHEKMQKELYEAQVGVMVSQIQPHFMYNALSSIAMMCTLDGKKAKEATITFAKYLRGNMDSLKQKKPVPFSQELEHLKKYLYIEKMRFEDALNIVYDIETEDFLLPQLSIQPLVENAVKHGVGMKEDGGTVTIATRETDEDFRVIISDDGVGFDMEEAKKKQETQSDGKSHVGMENTRRRIADLCGGSVMIESTPGEGTVATVILPKTGQDLSSGFTE